MDKSCANHPESMALATCKACDKSICLMCVVDEKEGTFCSSECHAAFVEGREVPRYVESAAEPASVGSSGAQKIESIFDDGPSAPGQTASEGLNLPPSDDPMPIVAEGTKWRSIGAQCENHSDTPAVANCDRCGKPVCALCLLEASQGTFCSSDCMNSTAEQPAPVAAAPRSSGRASAPAAVSGNAERAALQGKPVFNFKTPRRTNKAGLVAVLAVFAVVILVGGYYSWNIFAPDSTPVVKDPVVKQPDPILNPKPIVTPVDPKVVNPKQPVVVKNPDPVVVRKPDPEPPTVILRPRPVPKVAPVRILNPWAAEKPGAWYRLRSTAGGKVTYTDIGLKEKSEKSYVLATQTSGGPSSEKKVDAPEVYLRGEATMSFDNQSFLCETRTQSLDKDAPKTIVLLSGKYPGATFKVEGAEPFTTTKVWEYTVRVKNRSFDCLVIEGLAGKKAVKTYHAALPLQMVRQEKDGETTELVDFGDDWSKRPAFPN